MPTDAEQVLELVRQAYRDVLGREPTQAELAEGATVYTNEGEEAFLTGLAARSTNVPDSQRTMSDEQVGSWRQRLQEEAASRGLEFDESDVQGIVRWVNHSDNVGKDPLEAINNQIAIYDTRAASGGDRDNGGEGPGGTTNGGDTGSVGDGGASGWPTFAPPDPLSLPDPFSYQDYEAEAPFAYDPYEAADPFAYDPYTAPEPFAYDDFQAPTGESMLLDPSYQFRLSEGQRALDASAAARGTLRTGGHLKDTVGYGQQFASQEYGNIYDRASQQYGVNRGNALQNYLTNEGTRASTYDRNLGLAQSTYGTNEANRQGTWQNNYGVAKDIYGINAAGRLGTYNTNRQNAQDAYQSQYRTAGDLYGSQYQTAQDKYASEQRQAELQFGREWDSYTYGQDQDFKYWDAKLRADTAIAGFGTR
jgi:hypothetical protein|tara:strand:- start:142 stop:1401 length:1260 start_codon:yes stop_codon:yes gene_type:complete